jgi:hypothetical protein
MPGVFTAIVFRFEETTRRAAVEFRLRPVHARLIALAPVTAFGGWALLLVSAPSRKLAFWLLTENHPVELATFVILLAAGLQATVLAWRMRARGAPLWAHAFLGVFALGLLFVAGEEVAWGQWLLGFDIPGAIRQVNAQGELTLHNLHSVQGHTEVLRSAFGLGGLVGIVAGRVRVLRPVSVPPLLLLWFLVILGHAGVDLWNDYFPFTAVMPRGDALDWVVTRTSELTEMIVAGAGFFFVWLKNRALAES